MKIINNPELDQKIIAIQKKLHLAFDNSFTFNKSLGVAILAGTILAFVGSDCYGGIDFYSPVAVLVMASLVFSLVQVVLFIKMPMIRVIKFGTVLLTTCLLVKESFALYSVNILKIENACYPYLYTNEPIGYLWIIVPMLAIIGWCFTGNREDKLLEYLQSKAEPEIEPKQEEQSPGVAGQPATSDWNRKLKEMWGRLPLPGRDAKST